MALSNATMEYTYPYRGQSCDENPWDIGRLLESSQVAIDGLVAPAIIILGVVGNIASFFVLGKLQDKVKRMKIDYEQGTLVTIVFLRALAVFDVLILLTKFVAPSAVIIYHMQARRNQTLPFYAPLYLTTDSIFPLVQRIAITVGETMQTIGYWVTMLLVFQRLDQKCRSTAKSCCFVTKVGSALLIFFTAMICVGMNAQDLIFTRAETFRTTIPCTGEPAFQYYLQSSTEWHMFLPNQVAIGLRYAVPFLLIFLVTFGISITLCTERKKIDSSQLLLYWDMRLHVSTFVIGIFTLLPLAAELALRSCNLFPNLGMSLHCPNLLITMFLCLSNLFNLLLCAIKFPIYFFGLRPYRQICTCNTQDVSSDIGRAQYEMFRYSLRREKRIL